MSNVNDLQPVFEESAKKYLPDETVSRIHDYSKSFYDTNSRGIDEFKKSVPILLSGARSAEPGLFDDLTGYLPSEAQFILNTIATAGDAQEFLNRIRSSKESRPDFSETILTPAQRDLIRKNEGGGILESTKIPIIQDALWSVHTGIERILNPPPKKVFTVREGGSERSKRHDRNSIEIHKERNDFNTVKGALSQGVHDLFDYKNISIDPNSTAAGNLIDDIRDIPNIPGKIKNFDVKGSFIAKTIGESLLETGRKILNISSDGARQKQERDDNVRSNKRGRTNISKGKTATPAQQAINERAAENKDSNNRSKPRRRRS